VVVAEQVADIVRAPEHLLRFLRRRLAGNDLERLPEVPGLLARFVQLLVGRVLARARERLATLAIQAAHGVRGRGVGVGRRAPFPHAPCRGGEHPFDVIRGLARAQRAPVAAPLVAQFLAQREQQLPACGLLLLCKQLRQAREQNLVVAHGGEPARGITQPHVLALVASLVQRPQQAQAAARALQVLARVVHGVVVERRLAQRLAGARDVADDRPADVLYGGVVRALHQQREVNVSPART
jgi:hypothetical protein